MPRPAPHRTGRLSIGLPRMLAVPAVLAVLALAGCSGSGHRSAGNSTAGSAELGTAAGQAAAAAPADQSGKQSQGSSTGPAGTTTQPLQQRAIIRTASMAVTVPDVDRAAASALAAVTAAGGRADGDDRSDTPTGRQAELVLRVPPDRLDSLIAMVSRLGHEDSRTVRGQDVTAAQADVSARVRALTISVSRLQDFLKHSGTISDLVALESQLTQRESELQSTVAQQRALSDQVDLASLTLDLTRPGAANRAGSAPAGFGSAVVDALHGLLLSLRWVAAGLGYLLPFLLALAVLGVPAALWWRRRASRPGLAPPPEPATD